MLPIDEKVFLSVKELSKLYNLSVGFFISARKRKNPPPFYKKGNRVFYLKNEIDEWFKQILVKNEE